MTTKQDVVLALKKKFASEVEKGCLNSLQAAKAEEQCIQMLNEWDNGDETSISSEQWEHMRANVGKLIPKHLLENTAGKSSLSLSALMPGGERLAKSITEVCLCCGKQGEWQQCSRCKSVRYCSASCQTRDWNMHKHICRTKQEDTKPIKSLTAPPKKRVKNKK